MADYIWQSAATAPDSMKMTISTWFKMSTADWTNSETVPILAFGHPSDGYDFCPSSIMWDYYGCDIIVASKQDSFVPTPSPYSKIPVPGKGGGSIDVAGCFCSPAPCIFVPPCTTLCDVSTNCDMSNLISNTLAGWQAYAESELAAKVHPPPGSHFVGGLEFVGFPGPCSGGGSFSCDAPLTYQFTTMPDWTDHPPAPPNVQYPRTYWQHVLSLLQLGGAIFETTGLVLDSWNHIVVSIDWSIEANVPSDSDGYVTGINSAPRMCVAINNHDFSPTTISIRQRNNTITDFTDQPPGSLLPQSFIPGNKDYGNLGSLVDMNWSTGPSDTPEPQTDPPQKVWTNGFPIGLPGHDAGPDNGKIYFFAGSTSSGYDFQRAFVPAVQFSGAMEYAYTQIFTDAFIDVSQQENRNLFLQLSPDLTTISPVDDGSIAANALGTPAYWFIRNKNRKQFFQTNYGYAGSMVVVNGTGGANSPTDYFPGPGQSLLGAVIAPNFGDRFAEVPEPQQFSRHNLRGRYETIGPPLVQQDIPRGIYFDGEQLHFGTDT